jgi:hypothetical protein
MSGFSIVGLTNNRTKMGIANYEYALHFEQNDRAWDQRQDKLREVIMFFTKNTILQFIAVEVNMRAYDLDGYIAKGDRSEFLASVIDGFLSEFETVKIAFEESGVSDQIAEMARKITHLPWL